MILGSLAGLALAVGFLPLAFRVASGGLARVHILELWPAAAGVFFGGTTLLAVLAGAQGLGMSQSPVLDRYYFVGMICLGAYVAAATGFVLISFRCPRRPFATVLRDTLPRIDNRLILALVVSVWCVRAVVGLKYGIHYSGSGSEQRVGALPYGISVLASLAKTLGVVLPVWAYVNLRSRPSRPLAVIAFILLGGELLHAFLGGRRVLVFLAALLVLIELTYWRRRGLATVLLVVTVLALTWTAVPRFERARYAASESIDLPKEDLAQFLKATRDPRSFGVSGLKSNLPARSAMYVDWAAEVARALQEHSFFYGEVLTRGILFALPTVLVPGKREWEWGEQLINNRLEIGRGDSPNSIAMVGMADFGLSGVVIYAVGFGILLLLAETVASRMRVKFPLLSVLIALSTLQAAVLVEQTIVSLAVEVRNILLITVIVGVVRLLKVRENAGLLITDSQPRV